MILLKIIFSSFQLFPFCLNLKGKNLNICTIKALLCVSCCLKKKTDVKNLGVLEILSGWTYGKEQWPVKNTIGVYTKGPRPVNNTVGVKRYIFRGEIFQPLSWMLSFSKSDDLEALQKYVHLYFYKFFFLTLLFQGKD